MFDIFSGSPLKYQSQLRGRRRSRRSLPAAAAASDSSRVQANRRQSSSNPEAGEYRAGTGVQRRASAGDASIIGRQRSSVNPAARKACRKRAAMNGT